MSTRSGDGNVKVNISANISNILDDTQVTASCKLSLTITNDFNDGVQAGEINRAMKFTRSLSSGGSEYIEFGTSFAFDIGAGTGKDGVGADWDAEEIVMIAIQNSSSSAGNLAITADTLTWLGSHTSGNALPPGGWLVKSTGTGENGIAVTSTSRVQITASGGACEYTVVIFGRNDTDDSSSSSSSSSTSSTSSSSSSSLSSSSSTSSTSSSSSSS